MEKEYGGEGTRVNVGKTEVMEFEVEVRFELTESLGVHPECLCICE